MSTERLSPLTINNFLSNEDLLPVIIFMHSIAIIELIIPTRGANTPESEQLFVSIRFSYVHS